MAEEEKVHEIIIVRRRGGHGHDGHHGGSWKIAFADFMTAMMAFFLVLWIVNSTSKETRSSVARYFNPIKLAASTPARKGLQDPKENEFEDADQQHKKSKEAPAGGSGGKQQAMAEGGQKGTGEGDTKAEKKKESSKEAPVGSGAEQKDSKVRPGYLMPSRSEAELFDEPMAALADIARAEKAGQPGLDAPKIFRDPFEPIAPIIAPLPNSSQSARANAPASRGGGTSDEPKPEAKPPELRVPDGRPNEARTTDAKTPEPDRKAGDLAAAARKQTPEQSQKPSQGPSDKDAPADAALRGTEKAGEAASSVEALQARVANALKDDIAAANGPQIEVRKTDEGLLISVTDAIDFGMFAIGSAEPQPRTVRVLERLGQVLKNDNGAIVVVGHTDSRPFKAGSSDNWKLSVARAQMAFYMLMRGGVPEKRFERIEGHADKAPRNTRQTDAAENRRIEILVRKPQAAPR